MEKSGGEGICILVILPRIVWLEAASKFDECVISFSTFSGIANSAATSNICVTRYCLQSCETCMHKCWDLESPRKAWNLGFCHGNYWKTVLQCQYGPCIQYPRSGLASALHFSMCSVECLSGCETMQMPAFWTV